MSGTEGTLTTTDEVIAQIRRLPERLNVDENWRTFSAAFSETMSFAVRDAEEAEVVLKFSDAHVVEIDKGSDVDHRFEATEANWLALMSGDLEPSNALSYGQITFTGRITPVVDGMASFIYIFWLLSTPTQ